MCGIVGYIGHRNCRDLILKGLKVLEYRGYDSAGIACIDRATSHLSVIRAVGPLSALEEKCGQLGYDGVAGIGHTRWATHGVASISNAHPQVNCYNTIAVVHNGIIEDSGQIRTRLRADRHRFVSQTDTELIPHLFHDLYEKNGSLVASAAKLGRTLHGAYALVLLLEKQQDALVIMRRRSPLVLGVGTEEMFVASDQLALPEECNRVLFLPDESFAVVHADGYELYDFQGNHLKASLQKKTVTFGMVTKDGFAHHMLKEIYEQKKAITHTVNYYQVIGGRDDARPLFTSPVTGSSIWQQLNVMPEQVRAIKTIYLIAAGTSWHAGRIGQFFFEGILQLPTRVHLASEFRYMPFFPDEEGLYIFISQSGETADTLEAMRMVQEHEVLTVALTNVASSTIVREANGFMLMHAGPEISVASTKAFSCQVVSLYWLSHRFALERGAIDGPYMRRIEDELFVAAEVLESSLVQYRDELAIKYAPRYARYDKMIFLGRHICYPFAMEAALKLKEISYIFAQCYPAGELKHGPIALIDEDTPVVIFSSLDSVIYQKLIVNAQEVKARRGHTVMFAFEGQKELLALADTAFVVPRVAPLLAPLALTGVMQLFAYAITCQLGRPVDKPRNLAKSVTVE